MPTETRYPLPLTLDQLSDLKTLLDAATASEADPNAEIFALLDQVREAHKRAFNSERLRTAQAERHASEVPQRKA